VIRAKKPVLGLMPEEKMADRIISALVRNKRAIRFLALADRIGLMFSEEEIFTKVLGSLESAGRIIQTKRRRRGWEIPGYRFIDSTVPYVELGVLEKLASIPGINERGG
jgi:hypothetical protein